MGCGSSVDAPPPDDAGMKTVAPEESAAVKAEESAAAKAAATASAPSSEPVAKAEPEAKPERPPRYNELRQSPEGAKYKLAVVQFKVPGAKNGGSDKGPDGNRVDSIPIANSIIAAGGACDLLLYELAEGADAQANTNAFADKSAPYHALIVRINPGQLSQGTPENSQALFDDLMNKYIADGKLVWSSPKIQTQMGAKDALVNIGNLNCGLVDTYAYYSEEDLIAGFKKTCAFQPRVIKQNRGSAGEGIWLVWLWDKESNSKVEVYPSKSLGESSLGDDDYVKLMEMNDNHVEYHTVKEFMTFCVGGPDADGAGTWTSTFPGKYLEGGKEAGGQLVDQRLLPRIDEGEVRILMAGDTCQMAIHKKPMGGGLSAVGGNSDYTYYKPTDDKYKGLVEKLYADIPELLPSLGLAGEPLPLLWTCDYIPKNPDDWEAGPYDRTCPDDKTEYTVGEFNCSCVGISKFQAVCGGEQTLADVSNEDYYDACELTDLMGIKAIEMLKKANPTAHIKAPAEEPAPEVTSAAPEPEPAAEEPAAEQPAAEPEPVAAEPAATPEAEVAAPVRYNELRAPPAEPLYKLAVVQFKVPGAKNGGSDKGPDGNRVDSIPIANSVIAAGGACDLLLYELGEGADAQANTDAFADKSAPYDALIVRINPGQLSQGTPENSQALFDDLMNKYIADGKLVWSSPKIQTQMGAKDALVNIGNLNCGLVDTYAYYSEEDLIAGFKKTCAFQPRVIKQNRGSAGEGIWLVWLWDKESNSKVEVYPSKSLGESSLGDDDYVKLMEMNDNHVEYHTVKEFMTFCVGGPDADGAGTWTSTFPGKYLEGGKEAGGQLVDQRLLPRIDEGEVRILMAGDTCQMAIHKKPMGGGLSAVGGNSDYTYYKPTDDKYKGLVEKLYADIPELLPSLGLAGEPLPLLWTCDYIPKNPDDWEAGPYDRTCPDDKTEYTVGEFNCSCVGISKFQAVCGGDKTLADVPDEDYYDACELTDLMGIKAIEMLKKAKGA